MRFNFFYFSFKLLYVIVFYYIFRGRHRGVRQKIPPAVKAVATPLVWKIFNRSSLRFLIEKIDMLATSDEKTKTKPKRKKAKLFVDAEYELPQYDVGYEVRLLHFFKVTSCCL